MEINVLSGYDSEFRSKTAGYRKRGFGKNPPDVVAKDRCPEGKRVSGGENRKLRDWNFSNCYLWVIGNI